VLANLASFYSRLSNFSDAKRRLSGLEAMLPSRS
jgi:hypothetical protein